MFKVNRVWDVIAGVFLLILVYLLISKATDVNSILQTTAGASLKGIALLQGRPATTVSV